MENVGIFSGRLVPTFCGHIFHAFGMFYKETSGNPAPMAALLRRNMSMHYLHF
jgi:hypothetical protein